MTTSIRLGQHPAGKGEAGAARFQEVGSGAGSLLFDHRQGLVDGGGKFGVWAVGKHGRHNIRRLPLKR